MSYDDTKKVTAEPELPTEAINSELSEDEKKRVLAGLAFIGTASATARFTEPNGPASVTKGIEITVPSGTTKAFIYLGSWDFSFGPSTTYLERPLSHIRIGFGVAGFAGRQLDVDVRAYLRGVRGDDPLGGKCQDHCSLLRLNLLR
jgi:hypothetical protein